jgi:hypothetical protein
MNLSFFCALHGERTVRAIEQILPFFKHSQGYPSVSSIFSDWLSRSAGTVNEWPVWHRYLDTLGYPFPKELHRSWGSYTAPVSHGINFRYIAQHSFRDLCLTPDVFRDRFALAWTFLGKCFEQTPHFTDRHTVVDFEIIERALRHARISSVLRVLDNCNAAALLDGYKAQRAHRRNRMS